MDCWRFIMNARLRFATLRLLLADIEFPDRRF
jgi:hypothetical protein